MTGTLQLAAYGPLDQLDSGLVRRLFARTQEEDEELPRDTRRILGQVRREGDSALFRFAREFDGVELDALEVPRSAWDEALGRLEPSVRESLERAARNIEAFHRAQIPDEVVLEVEPGIRLGRRFVPLATAGVYAPGGRAAYPSSVLMGVVPARAVGVQEVVVCSPPAADGRPSEVVMAAAAIAGATRLFSVGGAGAVGAMAYGTEAIPRCDAVVGPGNRWVVEAKRQVAGEVVIDSPAGPSEVLVLAEEGEASPALLASELVAQAEHDPDAAVVFITPSVALLDRVRDALSEQVRSLPKGEVVEAALATQGALLLAPDRDTMLDFAQTYAAEHLSLCTPSLRGDLDRLTTSGTVFLGETSSVAFGDYMTGANHVLPTAGTARSFSGLSALNFMRSFTWQEISPDAARGLAEPVAILAEAEGLPGHAAAARMRGGGA
ncbi:MAG: histidinol dehydrogenase [Gemmatimonadales bacterium]|jgi:histidinol dehydrogenase|nr:MAG: histidinol dehydrogenase [Gemmatimonadales bacterium]